MVEMKLMAYFGTQRRKVTHYIASGIYKGAIRFETKRTSSRFNQRI